MLQAALAWCTCTVLIQTLGAAPVFQGPFMIPEIPRPVMVNSGDFNQDGKLDLVTANGTELVLVLLQDPSNRFTWEERRLHVGTGSYFVRVGDFDDDGLDDLVVADPASTAFFVRNAGEGAFESPASLPQTRTSRWITIGDWNKDGHLDIASANHDLSTVSVLAGDGKGQFTSTETNGDDTHAIEALDFNGDGKLDLALGVGTRGLVLWRGEGDGSFRPVEVGAPFFCVRYLATGELNKDGKGDLALTCDMDRHLKIAVSRPNGSYQETLNTGLPVGMETAAIADLNGDGNEDLAVSSEGATLAVHLGKGDGTFVSPPVLFGPIGKGSSFIIARDLDGDRRSDVVSADTGSSSLTILWGKEGDSFLDSVNILKGFGRAKAFAVADFDHDGKLDFFFPSTSKTDVSLYLNPGGGRASAPSLAIHTTFVYSSLVVVDLDGDGTPDLAGARPTGTAVVSLLRADGSVHDEVSFRAGIVPSDIQAGKLDEDDTWDLAVPCTGSNHVAVFLGQGGGKFDDARTIPSVGSPKRIALSDVDGDGRTDIVVVSPKKVAVHYGEGGGGFSEPLVLSEGSPNSYVDAAIADIDGDRASDVVILSSQTTSLAILKGRGSRQFENAISVEMGVASADSLFLVDVDGDGLMDITASSSASQSVVILFNKAGSFSDPLLQSVGLVDLGHYFADFNLDGALDLAAFSSSVAAVFLGRAEAPPPASRFRRGDVDANGKFTISDPILILNWLFRGGVQPSCTDAADTNDDGLVNLTDPIQTLRWLFQGGEPPSPPGGEGCGEDPTKDDLVRCEEACSQ